MFVHLLIPLILLFGDIDTQFQTLLPEHQPAGLLPAGVGQKLIQAELDAIRTGAPTPPFKDIHAGVKLPDGTFWIGSQHGLFSRKPNEVRWRLFASRRCAGLPTRSTTR